MILLVKRGDTTLQVFKKLSFTVETELKALEQVLGELEELNQSWIPQEDWLQCKLALAEGFTNAVRHAHRGLDRHIPINVEILITNALIEIRIWDYGPPFDLEAFIKAHKHVISSSPSLKGGGQGLHILTKIADHLSYIRSQDQRNCLLIVKRFTSQINAV